MSNAFASIGDYLDAFSDNAAPKGRPRRGDAASLFRTGAEVAKGPARDSSGFEIAAGGLETWNQTRMKLAGSRADTVQLAGTLGHCGCEPPRGLRGLSSVASSTVRVNTAQARYLALKADVQPLLTRFPNLDGATYRQMAERVVAMPRDALVRMTASEFGLIMRAAIAATAQNIGLANAILTGPSAAQLEGQAVKLLQTAESVMTAIERVLAIIATTDDYAGRAARAVGLSEPVSAGVVIAAIIGGTIVAVIAIGALYVLFAQISAAVESYTAVEQACALRAASGNPCTGEDAMAYRARVAEQQRLNGVVPNVNDLFNKGLNAVIVTGVAVVAGLFAYGLWVTAPAAREVRGSLARKASAYR